MSSLIRSAGVDKKCNSCLKTALKRRQQRVSTARATSREQCFRLRNPLLARDHNHGHGAEQSEVGTRPLRAGRASSGADARAARRCCRRSSSTRAATPKSQPSKYSARRRASICSRISTKRSSLRMRCRSRFKPASSLRMSVPHGMQPSA